MVIMVLSYELLYLQIFNVRDLYIPDKNPCETCSSGTSFHVVLI